MSEPHVVHLLAAESDLLADCHRCQVYLAICGAELPVSELAGSLCEDGCERELTYCQGCIRTANQRNYDAGIEVDCPPGIRAVFNR